MSSFANLFNCHMKDYPQTPDEFPEYRLEFLRSHEPSFKELGEVMFTKDEERSDSQSIGNVPSIADEDEEDLFELEVEVKLRRYTSFENGFMENHRKVLRNSLEQFLGKTSSFKENNNQDAFSNDFTSDIKSILFSENLFSASQISQNRERFRKRVDEFKILKELFENFEKLQKQISKDAVLLGLWILKHTDHVVQGILHENTFCIKEVELVKGELMDYLNDSEHIDILKPQIAQQTSTKQQFTTMIQSWLYTLLIAKLGYFENDCFDEEVSLEEHLRALLREEKRQHSGFGEEEDEGVSSLEVLTKKRKV